MEKAGWTYKPVAADRLLLSSSLDAAFAAARVASTFPGVPRVVSASAHRERRIVRRSY